MLNFAALVTLHRMYDDISQPIPQGSDRAQDAENSRIAGIASELERLCSVHEAQLGNCQKDVNHFEEDLYTRTFFELRITQMTRII